ncbi:acyltransferase family protein [Parvularcula lutaonensis]|nr:acyltransferase family protein [Parvularcula lutaonensis]GGY37414.1 acyltransferase [Parvularcula lutaonensis]
MSLPPVSARRHDLDWLRVIAFGLLIFYHIGMAYVPWDWHVKSPHGSEAWRLPMLMVNPWRLALLFFISGVAIHFASDKLGPGKFAASRLLRLGLPIVFGMAVIVMPQSYFELLRYGEIEPGILAFWPRYLSFEQQFSILTPTWNHLWYIVYLLLYVLILMPLMPVVRSITESGPWQAIARRPLGLLFGLSLPFVVYRYVLDPRFETTHALFGDWNTHAVSFTVTLLGVLAAKSEAFWQGIRRGLPVFLIAAVMLGGWRAFVETIPDDVEIVIEGFWLTLAAATWPLANVLYAWAVILGLLGLAQRFLTGPSKALRYLTGAVFCYYIVHQTAIVTLVALLGRREVPGPVELAIVTLGTVATCAISYEVFRRIPVLRIAFGIKS